MKRTLKWTSGLLIVGAAGLVIAGGGGMDYAIDWFTVEGGGGDSTGGDIEVSGTIGQPDAGVLIGGSGPNAIEIVGGFWGAPANENDCNSNGVIDFIEIENGMTPDCNANGVPDSCDITNGTSLDVLPMGMPDGVPDECMNVNWIGAGNPATPSTTNWSVTTNWSPMVDPHNTAGSLYFVTIVPTGAAGATINMPNAPPGPFTNRTIQHLTLGAAPGLDTLNIRSSLTAVLGMTIAASGRVAIGPAETAALNGGLVTIAAGGEVRTGSASTGAAVNASLDNSGTVRATLNRDLDITGARFANLAGGVLQADSGARITVSSQTVTQLGNIFGSGGAIVGFSDAVLVNAASATISLVGTTLAADSGLLNEAGGLIFGIGGQIDGDIVNEGDISFQGDLILNGDVTNDGEGVITASGDFNIAGGLLLPAYAINSGELSLEPGPSVGMLEADTISVGGDGLTHTLGLLTADGVTMIDAAGDVFVECTGELALGGMTDLLADGDLVLDGLTAPECQTEGGPTEPVLTINANAFVSIAGNFETSGCASITHTSSEPFVVAGSFLNHSTCATAFMWPGTLEINGTTEGGVRTFEAAGDDRGPTYAGFGQNFDMGTLRIRPDTAVTMLDVFDNVNSSPPPCGEALYVQNLILDAGATLTLSNARVYAGSVTNNGGQVTAIGCGQLVVIGGPNIELVDYANFHGCLAGPLVSATPFCQTFDYDEDANVDLRDFRTLQNAFGGPEP